MPWWAWLLVDVFLVVASTAVVGRAYWRGWQRLRAFTRDMGAVLATVPRVTAPRPRRSGVGSGVG